MITQTKTPAPPDQLSAPWRTAQQAAMSATWAATGAVSVDPAFTTQTRTSSGYVTDVHYDGLAGVLAFATAHGELMHTRSHLDTARPELRTYTASTLIDGVKVTAWATAPVEPDPDTIADPPPPLTNAVRLIADQAVQG
ncbi:hypothetical protein [Streptomyces sp. SID3212]|uniref:hypothetical protein n=1 Tax=Streptomyces sp. SID3212 TaxID=2690259 RepID=UPI00136EFCB6|nr:hypothetical protein [Streptomyces sp. SID3212]MYV56483.1 hypothetical protein [Streptomyces sp. SID3212]